MLRGVSRERATATITRSGVAPACVCSKGSGVSAALLAHGVILIMHTCIRKGLQRTHTLSVKEPQGIDNAVAEMLRNQHDVHL